MKLWSKFTVAAFLGVSVAMVATPVSAAITTAEAAHMAGWESWEAWGYRDTWEKVSVMTQCMEAGSWGIDEEKWTTYECIDNKQGLIVLYVWVV